MAYICWHVLVSIRMQPFEHLNAIAAIENDENESDRIRGQAMRTGITGQKQRGPPQLKSSSTLCVVAAPLRTRVASLTF